MPFHAFVRVTLCSAAVVFSLAAAFAQQEFSSANRQRGRAVIEYQDRHIHIVTAYNYSQRHHDSRWLMLQAAVAAREPTTIERGAIALRTPAGREIPLSSQRRVGEDVAAIRKLLQNASAVSHDVTSYFVERDRVDTINLFRLPFGEVVHDSFVADQNHVAAGTLFFESPTGAWEDGTYALIVRYDEGSVEMPIVLE
jgi:hypothetical protein